VEVAPSNAASLGRITIANEAVAQIVGHTAAECYGIVGMAPLRRVARVVEPIARAKGRRFRPVTKGISVRGSQRGLQIDLHVVVEYGLNLAEVAATLRSRVAYEVERLTGLNVEAVEVHIEDVRRSA
jgi:uncharacterized alkaline shock family protein YloU